MEESVFRCELMIFGVSAFRALGFQGLGAAEEGF